MVCKHIKQIVLLSFMLTAVFAHAQNSTLQRAQTLLSEKKIEEAKLCIDSTLTHIETKDRFETWTIRAFIYFEIYKKTEKLKINSPIRDTIVRSLVRSNALNPDEDMKGNNTRLLTNMASGYFNLAKTYLQDSIKYDIAVKLFDKYKEVTRILDPNFNFSVKDLDFYQAAGYIYSDMYNKDNTNTKAFETAKVALLKALEIKPDDANANMNMGLMYYHNGVHLIQKIDDISDFKELDVIQENAIKLAKQAEQFLLKVYTKDNTNKKAVEALYYNYKLLNDDVKKLDFKNKCKALSIEIVEQ